MDASAGSLPTEIEFQQAIAARTDRWYSACMRITGDRHLAEDAVQDALLSAWNKRAQFDRTARLDTWIHRIVVNAALQIIRKRRPATWTSLDYEIEDSSAVPETEHAISELSDDLGRALQRLSDIERVCFILKHLEQWRLKEIAQELDVSIGTIKQALFRAVKKLRVSMRQLRNAS